jgi:hypothetical protein
MSHASILSRSLAVLLCSALIGFCAGPLQAAPAQSGANAPAEAAPQGTVAVSARPADRTAAVALPAGDADDRGWLHDVGRGALIGALCGALIGLFTWLARRRSR